MLWSFLITLFTAPWEIVYWIKWTIAYVAIRIYNFCNVNRFKLYDVNATGDPVKLGFVVPDLEKELESPFPESHLKEADDEIIFYGVNSKTECLLVRISRGYNQLADAWIYLKLANGKVYHLPETTGYQEPFEGKCLTFSCGRLQMHYLCPMRRWRIFYCGMLKETTQNVQDSGEEVFVKFVFLWKASSDVYDLTLDTNPKGFAGAFARTEWKYPFIPPVNRLNEALNFYSQSGIVSGAVSVNDGDEYEMYLFGEKMRSLGKSANIAGCKFFNLMGNTPEVGFIFHIMKASVPDMFHNLPGGFAVESSGHLEPVLEVDIISKPFSSERSTNEVQASFTAGQKYEITGSISGEPIVFYSRQGWNGCLELCFVEFQIGEEKGSGLMLSGEVFSEPKKKVMLAPPISVPQDVPLTVQFSNEVSHFGEVSGGKGSSLGKLTKLSLEDRSFTVPKGLIVTTAAYKEFLTPEINTAVKNLEKVAYGIVEGDIKEACNIVSSVVSNTILPKSISTSIIQDLKALFGEEMNQKKFAVRSSATGEDTASMSAAGQMDTFLGVQGLKDIFASVKKCWASQFGHIAVEYKRRNGQVLNSPMAVVIQEMVACEVSGVLFTCDPVTNNPSVITITANYGLGETVVSGSVDPDTFTLKRLDNGKAKLDSINVGTKHQRIIMQESGGTITEDMPENSKENSCLTKETAESLASLGIRIENWYKSSRDIEWGLVNNNIYILQSRPVTSVVAETDSELKHEFDSPMRSENDYVSIANVGEVMPGAISPLGFDLLVKYFSNVIKREAARKGLMDNMLQSKYFSSGMLSYYGHMMLGVVEMLSRYGIDTPMAKGMMISIFGRILDDPVLLDYVRKKVPETPSQSIWNYFQNYWDLFFHAYTTAKVKKNLHQYQMKYLEMKTAKSLFKALLGTCSDFDVAFLKHMNSSESSSSWNMNLFQILSNSEEEMNTDVYSDFALLLSTSSNVESADVPQAMQEVANQLTKDINSEEFKAMSIQEAEQWLQTSTTLAGQKFREFIKRHGHRCLKEFDIRSITWGMDPKLLITLLQTMVGTTKDNNDKIDDFDKIVSELHVPMGFISRLLLKFTLMNSRQAVCGREAGKSLSIKSVDYWRKGYRYLGKLMASEGRIPEEDLIFFMTIDEIRDLLETRSPAIISRASRRQKLHPTLESYIFPEIMRGLPKPINDDDESAETYEFVADLTMKGIPVSQGVAKGYARVATKIEEAALLKKGEILIAYSTDIGWSPYFPIISGVVTELGGLISHGAVVSREYGLPCVVGLQGATKRFRTGDYVLLDGKKGILQRLPTPEQ